MRQAPTEEAEQAAPATKPETSDSPDLSVKTLSEKIGDLKQELDAMPAVEPELPKGIENYKVADANGKNPKFKPALFAEKLMEVYRFKTDRKTQKILVYDSGVYTEFGEQLIKTALVEALGLDAANWMLTDIYLQIKGKTFCDLQPSKLIAFENCLLDPETLTTKDFSPDEYVTNKLPTIYDPSAPVPPQFLKFVDQVCIEDKDALQELSGYLLLKDYRFNVIFWLLGTGRNGKGRWVITMQTVLGVENCSALGLEEFDGNHRFALYQLKNKLVNVSSEPKVKKILDTELVKKITGEDLIEAEAKGVQTRVKFSNTAKEIVLGNEYPRVEDTTNAFWDRVRLLNFPCRFVGKDQIQSIEKTWLSTPRERSGILNWMLEGLQRLLRNREFTMSRSQKKQIIDFKRASDSVGAFLSEMVVFNPKLFTSRHESYSCYKDYCDNIGVPSESEKTFYSRLGKTPKVKAAKKKQDRGFLGFAIKKKPDGQQQLPEEDDVEDLDAEEKQQKTLNFGADGTDGAGSTPAVTYPVNNTPTQKIGDTPAFPAPSAPSVSSLVAWEEPAIGKRECGLCSNFQKGTCSFPSGPECTGSRCDYAENCRDYKPKDGKGEEGC